VGGGIGLGERDLALEAKWVVLDDERRPLGVVGREGVWGMEMG
jgi:hypothetical protein